MYQYIYDHHRKNKYIAAEQLSKMLVAKNWWPRNSFPGLKLSAFLQFKPSKSNKLNILHQRRNKNNSLECLKWIFSQNKSQLSRNSSNERSIEVKICLTLYSATFVGRWMYHRNECVTKFRMICNSEVRFNKIYPGSKICIKTFV